MLSKIYFVFLGLSTLVMAFFVFYSWSWLQSIGQPTVAAAGYEYHAAIAWPILWITTFVLLFLGNAILWSTQRSLEMWVTFAYFAVMVLCRFFWLDQAYFQFRTRNNLLDGSFALGPFVSVAMVGVMAALIFFDQFIINRLRLKMFPPADDNSLEIPVEERRLKPNI